MHARARISRRTSMKNMIVHIVVRTLSSVRAILAGFSDERLPKFSKSLIDRSASQSWSYINAERVREDYSRAQSGNFPLLYVRTLRSRRVVRRADAQPRYRSFSTNAEILFTGVSPAGVTIRSAVVLPWPSHEERSLPSPL